MKYFFLFLISQVYLSLEASDVFLSDRLAFTEFYREEQSLFSSTCAREGYFEFKVGELATDQKTVLTKVERELSSLLPSNVLRPLVCARFIEKNVQLSARILTFWMTYKLMILRDYIDAPESTSKEILNTLRFLRTITEDESLSTSRLFELTQGQMKELGIIIANIQNDNAFTRAIQDTPILANNFSPSLKNVPNKIISPLGYISGNSSELIEENSAKLHLGNKNTQMKLPLFYEIPSRLNQEGHPSFMKSKILRKLKSVIDLSKDTLFINIKSVNGNLGGTLFNYVIENARKKIKLNSKYKVLIYHQLAEDSPLFQYLSHKIESDLSLKNAVKLLRNHPASSNTFIADIYSKKPFALTLTFPIDDLLLEQSKTMQGLYLRGPIVAALFFNLTSNTEALEGEWKNQFFDRRASYPSVGQEVMTIHLQRPEKEIHELNSAQINQILKNAPLVAFGSNTFSSELFEALYSVKNLSKKSQAILFFNSDQGHKEIRVEDLSSLERLRKLDIKFLSKNGNDSFTHLNVFSNKSLIFDNFLTVEKQENWFAPIQFFKSSLISKIYQDLKFSIKESKGFNLLNLPELSYLDEAGISLDYKTALKKSQFREKFKEIINQL
jgi:hypothetical protein